MAADLVGIGSIGVRLIEKISDATGVLYEPTRVVRRAKAEAKAAIMRAEADVEIADIQQRAAQRFINEQIHYQTNMEAIIEKASSRISDDASPESVGNDWLLSFFDKCRTVSEDEMQELWARVLAGEAERPGNTSAQTLSILQNLDQRTANLFRTLCSLSVSSDHEEDARVPTLGLNAGNNGLEKYGLNYRTLLILIEHGLILSSFTNWHDHINCVGRVLTTNPPLIFRVPFTHQLRNWVLVPTHEKAVKSELKIQGITFTESGRQLLKAVDRVPTEKYTQDLKNLFLKQNLLMSEVANNKPQTLAQIPIAAI